MSDLNAGIFCCFSWCALLWAYKWAYNFQQFSEFIYLTICLSQYMYVFWKTTAKNTLSCSGSSCNILPCKFICFFFYFLLLSHTFLCLRFLYLFFLELHTHTCLNVVFLLQTEFLLLKLKHMIVYAWVPIGTCVHEMLVFKDFLYIIFLFLFSTLKFKFLLLL